MLAYRHLFHAGNFADVFKHALLARLLVALARKDKPFCYVDTHAGVGRYDLSHEWAQKNAEYREGIARLWDRDDVPPLLAPYLEAVHAENPDGKLRFYPGSPRIAQRLLRPDDRAVLTELNKSDCAGLEALFHDDRRVKVLLMDGWQSLKAHLPPPERRGLVLIDASFDQAGEFDRLVDALRTAYARWSTGIYAIWFPWMGPGTTQAFERRIIATGIRRVLWLDLVFDPPPERTKLAGCGMVVVNPPYGFDVEAGPLVDWLARTLALRGGGRGHSRMLVGE